MAGSCFCSSKRALPFWTVPMSVFKVTVIRPAEPHIPRPIDVIAAERTVIAPPLCGRVQEYLRQRAQHRPRTAYPHHLSKPEQSAVKQRLRPEHHAQTKPGHQNVSKKEQLVERTEDTAIMATCAFHRSHHLKWYLSAKSSA